MTHQYTKLADALEAIAQKNSYPSPQPDAVTTMEAARILRAADAVDVGELMAMSDTSIVLACDYLMTHKESAKEKAIEHRAALESALRLVLAQREWQPIETAPKDGRQLILLLTPSGFPQVAYSNTWWTAGFSVECKPTHWMPLPAAAPQAKEQTA